VTPRQRTRLVHDVGKYVARTARNLPPAPTAEMLEMLVRDLYELRPGRRASAVFAELAPAEPALDGVRALLAEVDTLEPAVRAGEPAAVARAVAIAREVEQRLRALAEGT
jgi:predicted RNA-binding protein associated with RNAse of E/G family